MSNTEREIAGMKVNRVERGSFVVQTPSLWFQVDAEADDEDNFCRELVEVLERLWSASTTAASPEPVAWQVRRTDGSPLATWEACTQEAYDATAKTGRYCGYENGPTCEGRALYTQPVRGSDMDAGEVLLSEDGYMPVKDGVADDNFIHKDDAPEWLTSLVTGWEWTPVTRQVLRRVEPDAAMAAAAEEGKAE